MVELAEFVLARLREEEAGWLEQISSDAAATAVGHRRLDACRAEIRKVERHRAVAPEPSSWAVRELQGLALPYYDHPDFQPDWHPQRTRP